MAEIPCLGLAEGIHGGNEVPLQQQDWNVIQSAQTGTENRQAAQVITPGQRDWNAETFFVAEKNQVGGAEKQVRSKEVEHEREINLNRLEELRAGEEEVDESVQEEVVKDKYWMQAPQEEVRVDSRWFTCPSPIVSISVDRS